MTDSPLAGRRVLVVEDEFLLADMLGEAFADLGAEVIGPAPSVQEALALIASREDIEVAVLDANLGGELSLPVAEALHARGIPFLLTTGYDESALPAPMLQGPRCRKPADLKTWVAMLGELLAERDRR